MEIYVFKVDYVAHCQKCVVNLKKLLLKIDGVKSVEVDEKNDIVMVSGDVDPQVILAALRKKKKKAELLSNLKKKNEETKEPKKDQKSNTYEKGKQKEEPEHVYEPYVPKPTLCRDKFCKTHQSGFIIKSNAPSQRSYYPPPHWGSAPVMYYPQTYNYNQRGYNFQQPFRFDRQVPYPQFDPYMSWRPPRPLFYGPYGDWR